METTVQVDELAYQAFLKRASAQGRDVRDLLNEAMRAYLARPESGARRSTLRDLKPEPFPEGNERLSHEIDSIVYGDRRS
jgi:hypothetical protein